ncbi:MAG TPA: hypothetical protein VOA88_10295 [Candidatus Dormibacteraeota bacterium]|nr:hypothetical protein [Candidatus Dormibacteraeota bacterium]
MKHKASPTAEKLTKAITDIARFPDAVSVFYEAQQAGLCDMLSEELVWRVNDAAILFRVRNDAEHLKSVRSVKVDSGEGFKRGR